MKFKAKPLIIEATQWFKNGDHPEDRCETFIDNDGNKLQGEGKVVRYFRRPDEGNVCRDCKSTLHSHGWIDTLQGNHKVCPGDWVITVELKAGRKEYYPCKPVVFDQRYEPI